LFSPQLSSSFTFDWALRSLVCRSPDQDLCLYEIQYLSKILSDRIYKLIVLPILLNCTVFLEVIIMSELPTLRRFYFHTLLSPSMGYTTSLLSVSIRCASTATLKQTSSVYFYLHFRSIFMNPNYYPPPPRRTNLLLGQTNISRPILDRFMRFLASNKR
jgi:hypothetical protein